MKNKKQAFTLVELLVVIAIIGILATLAVVSLQNARSRARDSKRIADVRQMQTALELYFNDWNAYPLTASLTTQIASGTVYMAVVPTAPTPHDNSSGSTCTSGNNAYTYTSADGSTYSIAFCLGAQTGGLAAGVRTASPAGIQ